MLKVRLRDRLLSNWKKLWNNTREGRELRAVLISFPLGIITAMLELPGGMKPFGMAIPMAMPGSCALASLAGAVIGYSVHGVFANNLSYLAVLACVFGVKLLTDGIPRLRSNPLFLAAASCILSGTIAGIRCYLTEQAAGEWIVRLAEAAVTGGITYFAFFASRFILSRRKLSETGMIQKTSLLLLSLGALMGLSTFQISVFTPGQVLTCLAVLLAGERRNPQSAAETGICCTAALAIAEPAHLLTGAVYTACGYWAGHFAGLGRIRQTILFLLTGFAATVITGLDAVSMQGFFDLLLGGAFFLLLPQKVRLLVPAVQRGRPVSFADTCRTAARLRFSAGTLIDLEKTVEAVSQKLYNTGVCSIDSVYSGASDLVCRKCGLKLFCWDTACGQTNDAFAKLTPLLKASGSVTPEDLPPYFLDRCPKTAELTAAINNLYGQFISREAARRKVAEAKQVAAEQFEGLSSMLAEFSDELREIASIDSAASDRVAAMLREMGEDPEEVYCILDRYDRMRVEVYTDKPLRPESKFLVEELSNLLQRPLDGPSIVSAEDVTRTTFYEQARLRVQYGSYQICAREARISGDCCDTFSDGKGFYHLILSDGMGAGGRAAVDSIMTVSFVLRLIKAGFGFDAALKLINSSLLIRTGEETLATLDIGCIDLYTGKMEFLKAGAVSSFLCRDGKVAEITGSSLPAGILQGIHYDRRTVRLREGDLIVMMSDGAMTIAPDWIKEELALSASEPPEKIAQRLANLAKRNEHGPGDDITVMAAKIQASGGHGPLFADTAQHHASK